MSTQPCLLIMAGGTGGHIFPGLAVAKHASANGWHVVWMGNPSGMEALLVEKESLSFEAVSFSALRGKGVARAMYLPVNLFRACRQAWKVLRRVRPDVVLGMGGYTSFPGALVSLLLRIPLVIHEQNSVPGLSNRWLSLFAGRVLCAFPKAIWRGIWVGNPIRQEIADIPPPAKRYACRNGVLRLLVVGGSQGSAALNETIPAGLAMILEDLRPTVVHQAGEQHIEQLSHKYQALNISAICEAFIDDIPQRYAWADLVICRAGASTIAELTAAGVPAVLVPFPYAVDDHQTSNARFMSKSGAAFFMPQSQLTPDAIASLTRLERSQLLNMAKIARSLARPQASASVLEHCASLLAKRGSADAVKTAEPEQEHEA